MEDPDKWSRALFEELQIPVPVGYKNWIKRTMKAPEDLDHFNIVRSNAKATANGWKSKVNYFDVKQMNQDCFVVLKGLGYAL